MNERDENESASMKFAVNNGNGKLHGIFSDIFAKL
jgi:hypothetical protein